MAQIETGILLCNYIAIYCARERGRTWGGFQSCVRWIKCWLIRHRLLTELWSSLRHLFLSSFCCVLLSMRFYIIHISQWMRLEVQESGRFRRWVHGQWCSATCHWVEKILSRCIGQIQIQAYFPMWNINEWSLFEVAHPVWNSSLCKVCNPQRESSSPSSWS